jgi:putative NADH-flavin reductase
MARITVLGGTGYGGSAVVREAARRGHEVTSYSRNAPQEPVPGVTYRTASLLDPGAVEEAVRGADVVFVALSPRGDMVGRVEGVVADLAERAARAGVRVGVLGGVSSVLVRPGGPRLFDEQPPPAEILPEVQTGLDLLELLQESDQALDWFYVSPAQEFGSWVDAPVAGGYRVSDDVLLTDEAGRSVVSADDLALAVLDEIEHPAYRRRRLHVAL